MIFVLHLSRFSSTPAGLNSCHIRAHFVKVFFQCGDKFWRMKNMDRGFMRGVEESGGLCTGTLILSWACGYFDMLANIRDSGVSMKAAHVVYQIIASSD